MLSYVVLSLTLLLTFSQDALLSPENSFSLTISQNQPYRSQYIIEIEPEQVKQDMKNLWAEYKTQNACTVLELEYSIVTKEYPGQSGLFLKKCRFEGSQQQSCFIDINKMNMYHHLVKMSLETTSACNASITIGIGKMPSQQVLYPDHKTQNQSKGMVMAKIVGWMVFTLIAVLLAIRLAVKVADSFDKPAKPPKKTQQTPLTQPQKHKSQ